MSPTYFFLLLILSLSLLISPSYSTTTYPPQGPQSKPIAKYASYVKNACSSTTYPTLCRSTCLPYASKIKGDAQKLATTALSSVLTAAQSAASAITNLSQQKNLGQYDASVIRDCIENMGDSIDELKQSIDQIKDIGGSSDKEMKFKVSNIRTWMSAAITNENTCMDGMKEGGKASPCVKNKVRSSIVNVAKLTSVALSLCSNLQY